MDKQQLLSELRFKAVRSSGAGGQHVNKVSSKVELAFDVSNSLGLSDTEKERAIQKLASRLTHDGVLVMQCDEVRSQHQNKKLVVQRFFELLKKALRVAKKRKPTKPSKTSVEKRLQSKKAVSDKKAHRRKPKY